MSSSSSSSALEQPPSHVPVKRGRGRPPKSSTSNEDEDEASSSFIVPYKKKRRTTDDSDDDDDNDDDDDDDLDMTFTNALAKSRVSQVLSVPDFGGKPHMWFQTTQVAHMATLFKTLEKMLENTEIVFHPEGWRILAVTASRSVMISLRVTEHTLDEGIYDCNAIYPIAISVADFSFRIRMFRRYHSMSLSIEVPPDDVNHINMRFCQGTEQIADAKLVTRERSDEQMHCPPMMYRNQIDLPADAFKDVINSFKNDSFISAVTFTKTRDKFTVSVVRESGRIAVSFKPDANSDDATRFFTAKTNDDGETVLTQQDAAMLAADTSAECSATFIMSDIVAITTVAKAAKWVSLNMPEHNENGQKPLKITYSIAALGELSFYVSEKTPDINYDGIIAEQDDVDDDED